MFAVHLDRITTLRRFVFVVACVAANVLTLISLVGLAFVDLLLFAGPVLAVLEVWAQMFAGAKAALEFIHTILVC